MATILKLITRLMIFLWIYNIGYGISAFCLWAFFQSFFCRKLGYLIIISPSGVYYKQVLSSGVFYWNQVTYIKEEILPELMGEI